MIKLRNMLVAMVAILALSTSAFAGSFGVGVTGNLAVVSGQGSSVEGTAADESPQSAEVTKNTAVGSLFAEYTLEGYGGMTFGIDYIPGSADVSKGFSRTDTNNAHLEETGSATSTVRTANAEIENHMTYYAELPIHAGLFVKAGYVQMDVNTKETGSNSVYGNKSLDGMLLGAGYKNDIGTSMYYKVEGSYTDFDTLKLTSTGGLGTIVNDSTLSADLDVTKLTFALGYKF